MSLLTRDEAIAAFDSVGTDCGCRSCRTERLYAVAVAQSEKSEAEAAALRAAIQALVDAATPVVKSVPRCENCPDPSRCWARAIVNADAFKSLGEKLEAARKALADGRAER